VSAPEPRSPLEGRFAPGRYGATLETPVSIGRRLAAIVQVAARREAATALGAALLERFGFDLPPPNRAASAGPLCALWLQPETWLLVGPQDSEGALAASLATASGAAGAVVDQTHGRIIITLEGDAARTVLSRICRLDLHPRVFGAGSVAATPIAELPCLLHRAISDQRFEIVVFASFAAAFLHRLTEAAEGFGYEILG